jgi:hypothetical protein
MRQQPLDQNPAKVRRRVEHDLRNQPKLVSADIEDIA